MSAKGSEKETTLVGKKNKHSCYTSIRGINTIVIKMTRKRKNEGWRQTWKMTDVKSVRESK